MEIKKYSDISASLNGGANSMGWTNTMIRSNALPIDSKSIFKSMTDAIKYINESKLAYEGQIVAVTDGGKQVAYVVDTTADNGLRRVGSDPIVLSGEISAIASTYALSAENVAREELSVAMTSAAGTGDILSTYTFTQGGKTVGTVSIPKDKVISSAYMVTVTGNYDESKTPAEISSFTVQWNDVVETVTEASKPGAYAAIMQAYTGPEGGDGSYIRITVTNAEAAPVYIAVPKLVDTYVGVKSDTVEVKVVGNKGETREISAIVNEKSIGTEHLTTGLSTYIKNVVDAQAADRTDIDVLKGDDTTTGSVAKALKDAKAYTDEKTTGLSTSLSTAFDAKLEALDNKQTAYTDTSVKGLSTSLSNTVDGKFDNLLTSYLPENYQAKGSYLSTSVANSPSATDKLMKSSEVDAKIQALDVAIKTFSTAETLSSIEEVDGKIIVTKQSIKIDKSQVNDLTGDLDTINTKIGGLQTISADHASRIGTLESDVAELEIDVTGLKKISGDLDTKIDNEITTRVKAVGDLSTSLSNTVDAKIKNITDNYALSTDVTTISGSLYQKIVTDAAAAKAAGELSAQAVRNTYELCAVKYTDVTKKITATNKIVTQDDIKDLEGAMHFIGTATLSSTTEDPKSCLVRTFPNAKKGDVAIITSTAKEYVYVSETAGQTTGWVELGDETLYAKKADFEAHRDDTIVHITDAERTTWNAKATSADVSAIADAYRGYEETRATEVESKLRTDVNTLSGQVSSFSNTWKSSVDLSVAALSSYAKDTNDELQTLKTDAILSIKLNGQLFETANNIAELQISCISCGGAA